MGPVQRESPIKNILITEKLLCFVLFYTGHRKPTHLAIMRRWTKTIWYFIVIFTIVACLQLGFFLLFHFFPKKAQPTTAAAATTTTTAIATTTATATTTTTTKKTTTKTMTTTKTTTKATTLQHGIKLKTEQPKKNDGNKETYWKPSNYNQTLITSRTCSQHYSLVIVVSSAPGNWQRRNYIRKTWAFDRALKPRWTTVFLVGQSRKQDESKSLLKEDEFHGDLVRADFYDHYWNLTLKLQMGFEWATRYCSFSFLLKTDDDVFVNSAKLVSFLSKPTTPREKLYRGLLYKDAVVHREGKFKVTKEEYIASHYPDFCPGMGILLSHDTAFALVKTFPVLPFYRLEDVYVGLLADRIGIKPRNINGFEMFARKQCIPNPGTLIRHGFFERDGTGGECLIEIFNRANEIFKAPGV